MTRYSTKNESAGKNVEKNDKFWSFLNKKLIRDLHQLMIFLTTFWRKTCPKNLQFFIFFVKKIWLMVISCTVTQRFFDEKWPKKWPTLWTWLFFDEKSVQKIWTFWFSSCRKSDQWWSVVQWPQNNYAVNTTSKKNVIQLNEKSHEIHFSTRKLHY